jgi:hypothetical protein
MIFQDMNQIPDEQHLNAPVIFGCYKNAMPSNVNYAIRVAQINTLNEAIQKEKNGRIHARD